MKAAVFHGAHQPLVIEELEIAKPMEREVLVRTVASGVCHSDLHHVEGLYPLDAPAVLGHEAAGVVEAVGSQVTYVKPGDHVIACVSVFCGQCARCLSGQPHLCMNKPNRAKSDPPRLSRGGRPVVQFAAVAGYADHMLLAETGLVKIDPEFPMDRAALIGCGVITGVGAVLHTAMVERGAPVAVFGAGGSGLSAIQGARIAGARMIIAVDINEAKLGRALEMGATHVVDSSTGDAVAKLRGLTDGGADYTFEAIGLKQTAEQAFYALRPGGTCTVIGMIPVGHKVELEGRFLLGERKIQGCTMGSNRFRIDMPMLIEFHRQGRLKLEEMITRRGRLEDVNEAFRAMKAGEVARTVLMFP